MDVTYDELPFGFSWLPDEALSRTAHALDTGDGVWLVDPVDVPEAIGRATALGTPAGVLQLRGSASRTCACPPRSRAARSASCRCSTSRAGVRSPCGGPSAECSSSPS